MALPNPMNDGPRDAQMLSEHAHTPVCAAVQGPSLQGGIEDKLLQTRRQYLGLAFALANTGDGLHSVLDEGGASGQYGGP